MRCFQCKEEITEESDGMVINKDSPHEMYQCDDCHLGEFGYKIRPILLIFANKDKGSSPSPIK